MKAAFHCIALASLLLPPALAAETWIPLSPGKPPGTPAEVKLDLARSTAQVTHFDVMIHGFWKEDLMGPDQTPYQRIRVPGLGHVGQVGAPDLPAVRAKLAVVTKAKEVKLKAVTFVSSTDFMGFTPYPLGTPGFDEDPDPNGDPGEGNTEGTEEVFQKDPSIYSGNLMWPTSDAVPATQVFSQLSGVPGGECVCYPMRWHPGTKKLTVANSVHYEFDHGGTATAQPALTKGELKIAKNVFMNATALEPFVFANLNDFSARYLIVTPGDYLDELDPFILLKKSQGFTVATKQLAGGETWQQVNQYIKDWYQTSINGVEHYCLLVGDTNVIPLANNASASTNTDDYYGSPIDADLDEEVYVGRLSVDDAVDLTHQLQKLITYQTTGQIFGHYERALLVAHEQGAPGKYEGAHESVRTASYSKPPVFLTRYGSIESANAGVIGDILSGVGLVCYRGHGSTNTWAGWNSTDMDFHKNEVIALTNAVQPVVWAVTCTNHNIASGGGGLEDCIGETWLEAADGAAASYGATRTTGTTANHELDRRLFKAVYDLDLVTHAHAIAYAEAKMLEAHPDTNNPWAYNLLGDPSMKIRTQAPNDLVGDLPKWVDQSLGPQPVVIEAKDAAGHPLPGALIALYKQGSMPGGGDEVFDNAYADENGKASFQLGPLTLGDIQVTVQDDAGNLLMDTIAVVDGAGCALASNESYGLGKAGATGIPPSLEPLDLPAIGQLSSIRIEGGLPGAMPILLLGLSATSLPFDGGTLLVSPLLVIPIAAPIGPTGALTIAGTMPSDPQLCGLELYHQALYVDPGASGYYHVALTNGLKRTLGAE